MAKAYDYNKKPWLKFFDAGIAENIEFREQTLLDYLDSTCAKFPDKKALIFQGYSISYKELQEMIGKMATVYKSFGIEKGDSVAIVLPNLIPTVVAYYAALRLGAVVVMNNPLYSDRELQHQLTDSKSKIVVTLDLLANRLAKLRDKTGVKQLIYTSIGDYLPFPKNLLFPLVAKKKKLAADVDEAPDVYRWKELLASASPLQSFEEIKPSDPAIFQYTGGTTGLSKGVILDHENLGKQGQQIVEWFRQSVDENEVMLGALPFFHVFGLTTSMNLSIQFGWTNVLLPKPTPDALLESIAKFKVTFAPMVPTMYIGILEHPKASKTDLTSVKGCFSGSAPLPVEVLEKFERTTGAVIVEGFGLTESSPVTHINPFKGERKTGSIGLPISDTECRIVDVEDGVTDMPLGESGELLIRGPQVMRGYLNKPDDSAETLRDGWLYTGDIAKMDEEGYFYIVDRKKDMIISGGFNVYPREIDEIYYENQKVTEACTIGVPHERRGESAKVFIVLKEGQTTTQEEMIKFAEEKLAKYKWPTEIEFVSELPKSTVGKVLRKELRVMEMEKRAK